MTRLDIVIRPESVDDPAELAAIAEVVSAAFGSTVELGEPLVVLEGSPTYYSRRGFEYSVPSRHRD